jgi:hypothetical protein
MPKKKKPHIFEKSNKIIRCHRDGVDPRGASYNPTQKQIQKIQQIQQIQKVQQIQKIFQIPNNRFLPSLNVFY